MKSRQWPGQHPMPEKYFELQFSCVVEISVNLLTVLAAPADFKQKRTPQKNRRRPGFAPHRRRHLPGNPPRSLLQNRQKLLHRRRQHLVLLVNRRQRTEKLRVLDLHLHQRLLRHLLHHRPLRHD